MKKSEGQISLSAENVVWPGTIKIEGDDFSGECDYISPPNLSFYINNKMVNLDEPILTDEARQDILALVNDSLDTEGRSYKNCMKMMMEDGVFTVLPKYNDAWLNFLNPFLRLTRKEKNKKIIKFNIKK